uniref:Uncharacterized protein n=1 Tax=Wuchereria bancrofti TaxID=6293 RepID=A0AAF5PTN2_WUCBA
MQQENHEAEPTVSELFHTPEVEGLPKIIPTVPCQLRNIDPYELLSIPHIFVIITYFYLQRTFRIIRRYLFKIGGICLN